MRGAAKLEGILIRTSRGLGSGSSLALAVGIASSGHESIRRLTASLQRDVGVGGEGRTAVVVAVEGEKLYCARRIN